MRIFTIIAEITAMVAGAILIDKGAQKIADEINHNNEE